MFQVYRYLVLIYFNCCQAYRFHNLIFDHKAKASLGFAFHKNIGMSKVNLEVMNVFFNVTTIDNQLMMKGVSWGGGQENDSKSMEVFIEALTKFRVLVLDAYASIGVCNCCLFSRVQLEHIFGFGAFLINVVHCCF